ncbi:MAG: purine-nucleoside phosphorylase, partial [Desulfobacula sp.]|nr:purine-nucleoside phosphorylase [Desulfobacula sp.]
MKANRQRVLETVETIYKIFKQKVSIGVLTGTGIFGSIDGIKEICRFDYEQLPHFPVSTVPGHKGQLFVGKLAEKYILIMQGRFHLYEGYSPTQVAYPVRVMQELGVKTLIVTNAAGGINLSYAPGDIMMIKDHINLTGQNPLAGPNEGDWGIRFPDMTKVYDSDLIDAACRIAKKSNLRIHRGVYAGLLGPSLETPAEIRFLKTIGSDAVGLSTIMEVIAGIHAQMKILGISLITNINNPDHPEKTTLESVLETA